MKLFLCKLIFTECCFIWFYFSISESLWFLVIVNCFQDFQMRAGFFYRFLWRYPGEMTGVCHWACGKSGRELTGVRLSGLLSALAGLTFLWAMTLDWFSHSALLSSSLLRASLQDSLLSVGDALLFLQKATSWLPLLFARPGAKMIQAFTPALPLCIYFWPFEAVSLYFFLFSFLSSLCLSEMGYWKCKLIAFSLPRKERHISSEHKKNV